MKGAIRARTGLHDAALVLFPMMVISTGPPWENSKVPTLNMAALLMNSVERLGKCNLMGLPQKVQYAEKR